jgi:hypothetical protein
VLRRVVCLFALLPPVGAQPALEDILQRLAENQDRASGVRRRLSPARHLYPPVADRCKLGEKRQYTVAPTESGSARSGQI